MILRPYQQAMVDQAREAMRTDRAVILQLVTGGGKTPTACAIIKRAVERQRRVLFVAHRSHLLKQASDKLTAFDIRHALIKAGKPGNIAAAVQVASIQTLARRIDKISFVPDLICIDECHLSEAKTYKEMLAKWPKAYVIGLTATPSRTDGRGLGRAHGGNFDRIIPGPPMKELIGLGFLVPLKYFIGEVTPDTKDIGTVMGDFHQSKLEAAVDKPAIIGDAIEHWKKEANGLKTLVFCVSVKHAHTIAAQFREAGVRSVAVDGTWDDEPRERVLADFEAGKIDVLTNCHLYTEGLDIPSVGCVIDMAPTQSVVRYMQRAGRGMRTHENKKHCIYIDQANNYFRFGLPIEEREWNLEGAESKKKNAERAQAITVCPRCFCAQLSGKPACQHCGNVFEIKSRKVAQLSGTIKKITEEEAAAQRAAAAARREVGFAATKGRAALEEIARIRGYRPGWADRMLEIRGRSKYANKKASI